MKKRQIREQEELLGDIIKFLDFFNYKLPTKPYKNLFWDFYNTNFKKVDVLDKDNNVVGSVTNYGDNTSIIVETDDYYFECIINVKTRKYLKKFNFIMKDKNNMLLKGWMEFYRYPSSEDLGIEGIYHIVKDEIEIARSKFTTFDSKINLTDAISDEYINYSTKKEGMFKESKFFHYKKNIMIDVICDIDNIYYKMKKLVEEIKFKDDCSIVDNRYSYNGYKINHEGNDINYSIVEEEIKNVLQECDPEVFEFIKEQKNSLNYFSDNLFEKIFSRILFRLNKKSLMDIFGIDDSYKGSAYKK